MIYGLSLINYLYTLFIQIVDFNVTRLVLLMEFVKKMMDTANAVMVFMVICVIKVNSILKCTVIKK